jgi:hypothetical protein
MKRIIIAFLIAPFPAALIQAVFVAVWPKKGMGVFEHPQSMFVLMCLLFYVVELLVGLPLYFFIRKRLPQRLLPYGLAGALMALLPFIIASAVSPLWRSLSSYAIAYNLVFFAIGGFVAGTVFWRVTRSLRESIDLNRTFT